MKDIPICIDPSTYKNKYSVSILLATYSNAKVVSSSDRCSIINKIYVLIVVTNNNTKTFFSLQYLYIPTFEFNSTHRCAGRLQLSKHSSEVKGRRIQIAIPAKSMKHCWSWFYFPVSAMQMKKGNWNKK